MGHAHTTTPSWQRFRANRMVIVAVVATALLGASNPSPAGAAEVVAAAARTCPPATPVVARQYAGPDRSVTVMMEARTCSDKLRELRTNGRNEAASGKIDWAIALKYDEVSCHDLRPDTFAVVHPRVPVGGNQATHWEYTNSSIGYWWAEVSTTYRDGRRYLGRTSCWRDPG